MMLKIVKQKKNDERIAIRLPGSVRQQLQAIAAARSNEEVVYSESDVIREFISYALQAQQSENPQ